MKFKKLFIFIIFMAVTAIAVGYGIYNKFASPTRIAFINYPDYLYAEFADSNTNNKFIKTERINWKTKKAKDGDKITNLNNYDAVYIFGMGLKFSNQQLENLKAAVKNGLAVYVGSATSKENDINSITGKDLQYIEKCLGNSSKANYQRLLNYTRAKIDNKKFFINKITQPVKIPQDGLFYVGDDNIFKTVDEYEKFLKAEKLYIENSPKVVFLTSNVGGNSEHIQYIIKEFAKQKINVYPVFGFRKKIDFIKEIKPNLVSIMPHGRFAEVIPVLKELNIPYLCPINVFAPYNSWLKDQRGMAGGIMSQSITMPEIDGGIMPFALSAQFKNERGLYVFKPLKKRIRRFVSTVNKYLNLKQKANKDKKVVIVYYKGAGKNAMNAAGLEVAPSLFNTLKKLQSEGYNVDGLPNNADELFAEIQKRAAVFNPYAKGKIAEFVNNSKMEFNIPTKDYLSWVNQALPKDLYQSVIDQYGNAPGEYMNKDDNIVLSGIRYGNVVLMPQSLPAMGDDTVKIIHGAKQAPPHPYIATYLWARFGFKTDALIHFGTHGSFEFLPWKQTALSDYDWSDILIGDMPHFYIYTINNIGEAVIAKRRSYAMMVTHLTPPFMSSDLYDQLNVIHNKIHDCLQAKENEVLRREYEKSLIKLIKKQNIDKELKLSKNDLSVPLQDDKLLIIHNYIHEIENAKVNRGLYVLGRNYNKEEAQETARLMAVDAIAINMADVDIEKGIITVKQKDNKHFFEDHYAEKAHEMISKIFTGQDGLKLLNNDDLKLYQQVTKNHIKTKKSVNLMAEMMKMRANAKEQKLKSSSQNSTNQIAKISEKDKSMIKSLYIKCSDNSEKETFIKSFADEAKFEKIASLANPRNLARAQRMAKMIPKMAKTVNLASEEKMLKFIRLLSKNNRYKKYFISILDDPKIRTKILKQQEQHKINNIKILLADDSIKSLYLALNHTKLANKLASKKITDMKQLRNKIVEIKKIKAQLQFGLRLANDSNYQLITDFDNKHAKNIAKVLQTSRQSLLKAIKICDNNLKTAQQRFDSFIHAMKQIIEAVNNVNKYQSALIDSTKIEAEALINVLNGGYIEATPGADPIRNPNSIPTGKNLYSVDAEATPTKEAWEAAKKLTKSLIANKLKSTGNYPNKVAFTLWGGEFIRSHGTNVAQILYLLGVEPVWSSTGRVKDVKLIPIEELKRPRIDVIVQTSGQFRGAATSRIYLIDKAVKLAANANDNDFFDANGKKFVNNVKKGSTDAEKVLIDKGYSPIEARKLSAARVFGGVNGNFGTGIMGLVESGDKWDDSEVIADQYLKNMGAVYSEDMWSEYKEGIFEAAMQNTDTVVQPRSSNTTGPLSLDHVYEFMGGMNLSIKKVTGKNPDIYFNDLRNPNSIKVQDAKEAAMIEARSTILNPKYLEEMTQEGASAAESMAEIARNSYGWEVMRPKMLEDYYWEDLKATIIDDKHKIGMKKFFEDKNPYALQEMTAVMLETIRKGLWNADEKTKKELAKLHAEMVKKHDAGCSNFVCNNSKLNNMIEKLINDDKQLQKEYQKKIKDIKEVAKNQKKQVNKERVELKKQQPKKQNLDELIKNNKSALIMIGVVILLILISMFIGSKRNKEI
ncbi:cobaltochelatase subunit CobN [Lentisphaerota bacterium WC36G]|nr:cobaltochelatase subunit CobN [Lentisphaerae bacterium WC36]